jgi:predicted ATPase
LAGTSLPGRIIAEIVERADGIPLFVEELTKAVIETGADDQGISKTVSSAPHPLLIAQQHGMPQWAAYGRAFGALPLVVSGYAVVAVDAVTAAISDCERIQNFAFRPAHLTILASAELAAGRAERALAATANALELAERTREHWFTAETWRVRGQVLLSAGRSEHAIECFERALAVARSQSARLFELRVATSLARLWRDQGKDAEARDLLAPIYGWFTEGFDTADLQEAKALLDELALGRLVPAR